MNSWIPFIVLFCHAVTVRSECTIHKQVSIFHDISDLEIAALGNDVESVDDLLNKVLKYLPTIYFFRVK